MIMDDYFGFNESGYEHEYTGRNSSLLESLEAIECPLEDTGLAGLWTTVQIDSVCRRFNEATALDEIKAIDEAGSFMIYERFESAKARIEDWFDKAKETLKKIWQYVKGFFVKAFKILESVFATNHKFMKDNQDLLKTISASTMSKITFSGYKYSINVSFVIDPDEYLPSIDDLKGNTDTDVNYRVLERMFGAAAGAKVSDLSGVEVGKIFEALTAGQSTGGSTLADVDTPAIITEMKKVPRALKLKLASADLTKIRDDIFKRLRSGKSSKLEIKANQAYSSVDDLIAAIGDKNSRIKEVNQLYKDFKEDIDKELDDMDTLKNDLEKKTREYATNNTFSETNKNTAVSIVIDCCDAVIKAMQLTSKVGNASHAEYVKAIKGNASQAKAVARQMIIHGAKIKDVGKGGKFTESASLFDDDYGFSGFDF